MLAKSNTWRIDNRCLHIHDSDKGHNGVECWSSLTCECHFSSPSVVFKGSLIRNHAKYLNLHCKFMVSLHTNSCKKKDGAMERLKSTCMHTNSCKKKKALSSRSSAKEKGWGNLCEKVTQISTVYIRPKEHRGCTCKTHLSASIYPSCGNTNTDSSNHMRSNFYGTTTIDQERVRA